MDEPVPYDEIDAQAGVISPSFVDEPDGYYTRRVVLDSVPTARWVRDGEPPDEICSHIEPLATPIVRTRRVLRWFATLPSKKTF